MKKKLIFIGMIGLALALTTGTFAFTFTNYGTTEISGYMADGPFASYEISASQPNWESVMPEGEYSSEILVPMAAGDYTTINSQYPASGEHWDKVDEQPTDENATYVSTSGVGGWQGDIYELSDMTADATTINSITLYMRFASGGSWTVWSMIEFQTNGDLFSGPTEQTNSTSFVTVSWQCDTNPSTGEAWTWEEVNDLQVGVALMGNTKTKPAFCTQLYVQVNYEYTTSQGDVPEGALFNVMPHPEFTGDLMVKVYLTNTAALMKAYKYLNIKVYTANTIEAGEDPNYQILSMENGFVTFNIIGGTAASYVIQVTGGSYRLMSENPDNWGSGWSITPEFYCEVTQR